MDFDKSQIEAIERALRGEDVIITGGAGTGKTTIIGEIAKRIGVRVKIMAPTGKAAARLKEATGYFACTVHRALGWDGEAFRESKRIDCPVIVDESSMLDSWLLARLLERKPPQVILVGDAAQLPPVGRGQPFHDLVRHRPDITVTLSVCHRNQAAVHRAANLIREGKCPAWQERAGGESWSMKNTGGGTGTEAKIVQWANAGALDPMQDVVLAAKYGVDETDDGNIISLNKKLLDILNPHRDGNAWQEGDRVLCCKNFASLDLWNGDIGTVTDVDVDGNLWVKLDRAREDSQTVLCEAEHRRELKHAYCLSVHKAQGSQFRRVIVVCLRKHWHMMDRALIYTAVTRAREGCVVCGELNSFFAGIQRVGERKTMLQQLIQTKRNPEPCK